LLIFYVQLNTISIVPARWLRHLKQYTPKDRTVTKFPTTVISNWRETLVVLCNSKLTQVQSYHQCALRDS